jgi:transcription elongation factor Elf1
MKGYWMSLVDEEYGDFVIAENVKTAKKLFIDQVEWLQDCDDWFIRMRVKLDRSGSNIEGLPPHIILSEMDLSAKELIEREIQSWVEYGECPFCKRKDVNVSKYVGSDGVEVIACNECEGEKDREVITCSNCNLDSVAIKDSSAWNDDKYHCSECGQVLETRK